MYGGYESTKVMMLGRGLQWQAVRCMSSKAERLRIAKYSDSPV